ncbi:PhnA protein [Candidatus Gracilibacteria bacterium 28_42_T64]|nr:PhnA protein [Candidatus Gracilibacteria bacterium 28_42_T64]
MGRDFWQEQDNGDDGDVIVVTDANGNVLHDGDSVAATKDIKVKGASDIKRGDKFKNIRLTDDEDLIESGKMVLRTEFFKKI